MKRKFLEDLGLEKEAVDKIMEENGADIENAKKAADQSEKIKELETERDGLSQQIKERDKQLSKLKKETGSAEELQAKIDELETANKEAKKNAEAEIRQVKIDAAVSRALTESRAKNPKAVKALLDLDDAKLAEDGSIVGLSDQIKGLQKAEDSKFLFDNGKMKLKGAEPGEPSDPEPKGVTQDQFNKMNYQARLKLFNDDRGTYDALAKGEAGETGEDPGAGGAE